MKWVDVSNNIGGHNGEYDWQCSNCNHIEWFARYTNPNREKCTCWYCKQKPDGEQK